MFPYRIIRGINNLRGILSLQTAGGISDEKDSLCYCLFMFLLLKLTGVAHSKRAKNRETLSGRSQFLFIRQPLSVRQQTRCFGEIFSWKTLITLLKY